jgi:hypothetical protein
VFDNPGRRFAGGNGERKDVDQLAIELELQADLDFVFRKARYVHEHLIANRIDETAADLITGDADVVALGTDAVEFHTVARGELFGPGGAAVGEYENFAFPLEVGQHSLGHHHGGHDGGRPVGRGDSVNRLE